MTFLRFTPSEYRTLKTLCNTLNLPAHNLPTFRRLLVAALDGLDSKLASRIKHLGQARAELLYFHFQPRPAASKGHELTSEEVQTLREAYLATPSPVRFVKLFKKRLVEVLYTSEPELAQKVERMSLFRFEQLYQNVVRRE